MCVIKQLKRGFTADGGTLSGVVHAEKIGKELTLYPRILSLAPVSEGNYAIAVKIAEKTFIGNLKDAIKINDAPSLKDGFCALICFVKSDAEALAFGRCGNINCSVEELLSLFEQKEERKKKTLTSEQKEEKKYDDEAIADANYYEDENAASIQKEKGGEAKKNVALCEDEENAFSLQQKSLTYYNENREKIEECLKKYPKDERLKGVFPTSEWVNKEGTLFGVIYENGYPLYVCVAVEKGEKKIEQAEEEGVFVPTSFFHPEEGFYVIFKSAHTGEQVNMKSI